jgi:hypothetical protein
MMACRNAGHRLGKLYVMEYTAMTDSIADQKIIDHIYRR